MKRANTTTNKVAHHSEAHRTANHPQSAVSRLLQSSA